MRRMYSEQELTTIINEVITSKITAGAFDDKIADAVDDYLEENPVDITALNGKTITPAVVNATSSITAPSIIESMNGYSAEYSTDDVDFTSIFTSAVKNGNKITFVVFGVLVGNTATTSTNPTLIKFNIPSSVGEKLHTYAIGGNYRLYSQKIPLFSAVDSYVELITDVIKISNTQLAFDLRNVTSLTNGTSYYLRVEVTFLLSHSLL